MSRLAARLRTFKDRLAGLARRPGAVRALFAVAFIEASVLPLPPDFLLVPLLIARPEKTMRITTVCIAGSVAGAMIGYLIGATVFDAVGERVIGFLGVTGAFDHVLRLYRENALWTLLFAGFTSIPFNVFTIAAGFRRTLDPVTLFAGALMGRMLRFYLLAGIIRAGGPFLRRMIEDHLPAFSLAVLLVGAAGIILLRFLS